MHLAPRAYEHGRGPRRSELLHEALRRRLHDPGPSARPLLAPARALGHGEAVDEVIDLAVGALGHDRHGPRDAVARLALEPCGGSATVVLNEAHVGHLGSLLSGRAAAGFK